MKTKIFKALEWIWVKVSIMIYAILMALTACVVMAIAYITGVIKWIRGRR